jgi:putative membrane protein
VNEDEDQIDRGVEAHHLHPLTVLLEMGRVLGRVVWFFAVLFVVGSLGGRKADPASWIFLLAGSGVLVALFRYLSLRYWVDSGRLVIRSGLLSRRVRTIPLDKIQNVELRQKAIHQLAGVVDFRIETAAGPEAEAHLAVLSRDAAERLKTELLAGRAGGGSETGARSGSQVVWRASLGDLVLLGATSNRAGVILGALAGLLLFVGQELPRQLEALRRGLSGLSGAVSVLTVATISVLALLLLGWLLSIVLTGVGYYGFTVTRDPDGRLRRRYGLLSRFETVVNPARIQLLRLGASWVRRRIGLWEVGAHTAGASWDGHGTGSAMLCPLLRKVDLARFCDRLLPGLDLDAVVWHAVSRATVRRGLIRYAVVVLLLAGATSVAFGAWAWAALVPGGLSAWALARHRYRVLAHSRHAGYLLVRSGLAHRRVTIVPESKVQWVGVTQSPPQRRLGIATVRVSTAAGAARIVDLERSEALVLQQDLSRAASAAGAWLPDAV